MGRPRREAPSSNRHRIITAGNWESKEIPPFLSSRSYYPKSGAYGFSLITKLTRNYDLRNLRAIQSQQLLLLPEIPGSCAAESP